VEGCAENNSSMKRTYNKDDKIYLHILKTRNSLLNVPTVLHETLDRHCNRQSSALRDLDNKSALIGVGLNRIVSIMPCLMGIDEILTIVAS
jgi:hypothetical protein